MWKPKYDEYLKACREKAQQKALSEREKRQTKRRTKALADAKRLRAQLRKHKEAERRRRNWELCRLIEWGKANPTEAKLRAKSYAHGLRVKIHQDEPHWTPEDVDALLNKQHGRCANRFCRQPLDTFEIDHIVPITLNGTNTARNIQLLCYDCNRKKGTRAMSDFMDMCESLADG